MSIRPLLATCRGNCRVENELTALQSHEITPCVSNWGAKMRIPDRPRLHAFLRHASSWEAMKTSQDRPLLLASSLEAKMMNRGLLRPLESESRCLEWERRQPDWLQWRGRGRYWRKTWCIVYLVKILILKIPDYRGKR